MADMTILDLNRKMLCNDDGSPLAIDHAHFVEDVNNKGEELEYIAIGGKATSFLLQEFDPTAGARQIEFGDGVLAWEQKFALGGKGDTTRTFAELNRAFKFKSPLVDREDEFGRFFAEHPESVLPEVLARPVWVQVSAQPSNDPQKYGPKVYFNIRPMAARRSTSEAGAWADYQAKRAAKKAKAAADDAVWNAPTDAADLEPSLSA